MFSELTDRIRTFFSGNQRSVVVKKNIVYSFLIRFVSIVVSFLLVPITIGYVNADLYGVWLTLSSMMIWLGFADVGFTQGLKNKLTEAIAHNDFSRGRALVSTTYFMMIVIFVPVTILLELLVPLINWAGLLNVDDSYSTEITEAMHVLVAFACLQMVLNVLTSVVSAFQKVALSNSFLVIANILSLIIVYVLRLTIPPSLVALAFSIGAMPSFVMIIASLCFFNGKFKEVSPKLNNIKFEFVRDLFGLGWKFFVINIQVLVLYQSTNVLISHVSSPADVTHYNIAYKLLSCAMMAYTIITTPLWPAYTDAYARDDYEWMRQMRNKMQRVLLLSMCGCILLACLSQPIYYVWVGDSVSVPYLMTFLVALYVIIYCWMTLNGTLTIGMGKLKVGTYMIIIGMILHLPLSLYLSKFIGAYGVLTSLILINFVYAIISYIQVKRLLNHTAIGIWNE